MDIKKILLIFLSLAFSISIIMISAFKVCQTQAQNQAGIIEELNKEASQPANNKQPKQAMVNEEKEVDYYLPYPGILPDHFLYWLKMVRDRVLLILTREPKAKVKRLLLYADKRLGAAQALIEGGKVQLGITTASKAEKYLEKAVFQFNQLEKPEPEIKEKLTKAVKKHQQVLTNLASLFSGQSKEVLEKTAAKTRNIVLK